MFLPSRIIYISTLWRILQWQKRIQDTLCAEPDRLYANREFAHGAVCVASGRAKTAGDFILRIEDTDQERYVEGAVDLIYKTLEETGLTHDEGPDVGGDYGPYIQSERRGLYKQYAEKLVELGAAYYCFCDKERLEELRAVQTASKVPPKYDGHARACRRKKSKKS